MKTERKDNMEKYDLLSDKLMQLIGETGNEELMDTYLDWQAVRNDLNEEFMEIFKSHLPKEEK